MPLEPGTDWTQFKPRDYLNEYYSDVGPENLALLRFLAHAFRDIPEYKTVLDFGGGPTIYALISACDRRREIHICDYLEANLEEVRKWIRRDPDAFDWHEFIATALEVEGQVFNNYQIHKRAAAMRGQITFINMGDASQPYVAATSSYQYDVVMSNFCADSATDNRAEWQHYVHNIASYLKPSGRLIISALRKANSYTVGKQVFPAVFLAEDDLIAILDAVGCDPDSINIETVAADRPSRHYEGLMFAFATKLPDRGI